MNIHLFGNSRKCYDRLPNFKHTSALKQLFIKLQKYEAGETKKYYAGCENQMCVRMLKKTMQAHRKDSDAANHSTLYVLS